MQIVSAPALPGDPPQHASSVSAAAIAARGSAIVPQRQAVFHTFHEVAGATYPRHALTHHRSVVLCLALMPLLSATAAPLAAPTPAQYAQAMGLSDHYASLVDRQPTAPVWVDAGHFLYRREVARSNQLPAIEYRLVEAASGRNTLAFDHARLAAALTQAGAKAVDAGRLQLEKPVLKQQRLSFQLAKLGWQCDLLRDRCAQLPERDVPAESMDMRLPLKQGERQAIVSPDGRWRAWVERANLIIAPVGSNERSVLSHDGSAEDYYALDSVVWSPDSQHLAAYRVKAPPPRMVYYIESAPADQVQPKLHQQVYPSRAMRCR